MSRRGFCYEALVLIPKGDVASGLYDQELEEYRQTYLNY